jgi:copper resistance protein D
MIHSPEAPFIKMLLLLSCTLLIGTGLVARYIAPRAAGARWWRVGFWAGGAVLILTSLVDVGFTAWRALLELNPQLYGAYLTNSRHGQWVMTRVVGSVALLWLGLTVHPELRRFARAALIDRVLHGLACFAVGLSLSMTTHSGSSGEVLPIAGDLVHLAAMIVWVSAVLFLAFEPLQHREGIPLTKRVSSLAAICVGALTLTGLYQGVIKLWAPALLIETQYGGLLTAKLGLFAVILTLGAANRFLWIPRFERRPQLFGRFQGVLRVEALALIAVLGTTSALGTTAPPERDVQLEAPVAFNQKQGVWTLEGKAETPAIGGVDLEFRIAGAPGYTLTEDARVEVIMLMQSDAMRLPLEIKRDANGVYRTSSRLGMKGDWQLIVRVPGATWRIPMRLRE